MRTKIVFTCLLLAIVSMGWAASYSLYVDCVHVTDANKNDILGNGMFSFDPTTSTLTMHGGDYLCSFRSTAAYKGFIYTENDQVSTVILDTLIIFVEHNTTITQDREPSAATWSSTTCWDGVYATIPTTLTGRGRLEMAGFFGHCVHVKNNLRIIQGNYSFISGIETPTDTMVNKNYASHCIYQEGSQYKLYISGGYIKMKTYSDLSTDRASVMRYDGGIDFSGAGRLIFVSPESNLSEVVSSGSISFDYKFTKKNYLSDSKYISASYTRYRGIQQATLEPKIAPITYANHTEWPELIEYYKHRSDHVSLYYYEDGTPALILDTNLLTLPKGLLADVEKLTILCNRDITINCTSSAYAIKMLGSNLHFTKYDYSKDNPVMTINGQYCISTSNGLTVNHMALHCIATGTQAITITSPSTSAADHAIKVCKSLSVLHAKASTNPIYGVQQITEGYIYNDGKIKNNVIVGPNGNAMTDVTIGFDEDYPLYIVGEKVNISTRDNIRGDGKVRYRSDQKTLYLSNAYLYSQSHCPIWSAISDLQIVISGTNTLKSYGTNSDVHGIYCNGSTTITSAEANATLDIYSVNAAIYNSSCTTTIEGSGLTVNLDGDKYGILGAPSQEFSSDIVIKDATVNIEATSQGAICNVSSLTLTDVQILAPTNTQFSAKKQALVNSSGSIVTSKVLIGAPGTGIEEVAGDRSQVTDCKKVLRDGQLIILRDGKTYNAVGQEL